MRIERLAGGLLFGLAFGVRAASLQGIVQDADGQPLADAVVTATPAAPAAAPAHAPPTRVDQRLREFIPHVHTVRVGSEVSFPNSDQIQHHVYSFSTGNRFEIKLYKGTPAHPIRFDQPGVVVLGCNIHDWMLAYVYVADTPYFTQTAADGQWALTLPAGDYQLTLWHPQLPRSEAAGLRFSAHAEDGAAPALRHRLRVQPTRRNGKPPAEMQEQDSYRRDP